MEFKKIENFTKYFVCDDGFVYKACGGARGLKKLKGMPNTGGYRAIVMVENGYKERHLVHRLVAKYFIPNPDNLPYVDHINTIPTDNRVENLRWVDPKGNSNNPLTVEHATTAQRKIYEKPITFVKEGIKIEFDNQYIAAQYFETDVHYILECKRKGETIYGFSISQMEEWEKIH